MWYKDKREWLAFNDPVVWYNHYLDIIFKYPDSKSVLFNSFLKLDEIRPFEKLQARKVRQINGPHFLFLILQSQLFRAQNEQLKKSLGRHPSCIGISIFGSTMQVLLREHSNFSHHHSDDISGFDSSVGPKQYAPICAYRQRHAPRLIKRLMEYCYLQVCFGPLITTRGEVFSRLGGNCSGQLNTGEDNTFVNTLLSEKYASVHQLPHKDSAYGDDGLHSTQGPIDLESKREIYAREGFILRDLKQSCDLSELSFLQRVPFLRNGVWLTKHIDGDKALDSLFYMNPSLDPDIVFQRACGMRIIFFWNRPQFHLIDGWAKFLLKHYKISDTCHNMYLSGEEIENLYLNYEL
jgi:hypothetical protein